MNSHRFVAFLIVLVQILDIVVHVGTNQIEPLRIAASIIVMVAVALVVSGQLADRIRQVTFGSVGICLVLNGIFLALAIAESVELGLEPLINPVTQAPRTILFVFVGLTVALLVVFGRTGSPADEA